VETVSRRVALWSRIAPLLLIVAACSDSATGPVPDDGTNPPPPTQAGKIIINASTDSFTDIVRRTATLRIQAFGEDGRPDVNALILFQVQPEGANAQLTQVRYTNSQLYGSYAVVNSDADGFATVVVQHSTKAGVEKVRVSSARTHAALDVALTTLPGPASRVTISTPAAVLQMGSSFQATARVEDQYGNLRDDPVVFSSGTPGLTVTADGIVRTSTGGVYAVNVQVEPTTGPSQGMSGSSQVWVVPSTDIAFAMSTLVDRYGKITGFPVADDDTTHLECSCYSTPAWQPGQDRVAFSVPAGLLVREPSGALRVIEIPGGAQWPEYSPDGQYLYYSTGDFIRGSSIYRIRASDDAPSPELVTAPNDTAMSPTLSPDGRFMAYASNTSLKIMDLQQGTTRVLIGGTVNGGRIEAPRWSPDGARIVYMDGGTTTKIVSVQNGTASSVGGFGWSPGYSWSNDSQWIVGFLGFIGVTEGRLLHVPTMQARSAPLWMYPSWKRN
jgi:WD40 repeat protein